MRVISAYVRGHIDAVNATALISGTMISGTIKKLHRLDQFTGIKHRNQIQ